MTLLVAACTSTATPSAAVTPSHTPAAPPTPTPSASVAGDSSAPAELDLPDPARPFDAAGLLSVLLASQRPDGVPAEALEAPVVAALADAIWSFEGDPWVTADAGGSCGPDTCLLELAGTRPGYAGDDLWVFEIDRATSSVQLTSATLQGVPTELTAELDALAREIMPRTVLEGALLTGVRWLPPPDAGSFVLSYRTGGDDGSCLVELTLDAREPAVVVTTTRGC